MTARKKLLVLLVTNYAAAMADPAMARAAWCSTRTFPDNPIAAQFCRCLICNAGRWRDAVEMLSKQAPADWRPKIDALVKWARALTQPKKRGLLIGWQGGAV